MRLLERFAVLLRADAHGVIESLEERSLLLKQYLREAEMELDRGRARLEALRDRAKALRDVLARERETIESLDQDVELALAGGKDDLARFAIRRLLSHRREATDLALQIEQCDSQAAALEEKVEGQRRRYEELETKARAELHREQRREVETWCDPAAIATEEVEIELMRRRAGEVSS